MGRPKPLAPLGDPFGDRAMEGLHHVQVSRGQTVGPHQVVKRVHHPFPFVPRAKVRIGC
jgi:hypothetical protein